uniref:Aryl hydrocarbon receptor-interacting protein AIP722 n=1 Tax=Daphnia magna TaxID=35525 RepID=A0A0P5NMD3_9CRUS
MSNPPIQKKIIHAGNHKVNDFPPDTKVRFHFIAQVITKNSEGEIVIGDVIDDSHNYSQPIEILIGKKFKLEVWETIVQTMAVNEVAEFHVEKNLCLAYPLVAKTLRDAYAKDKSKTHEHPPSSHCCGAMALANGPKLGYDDLNQLMEKPTDLLFRIELLGVDLPQSYQKETWQMDERERLDALPRLKHEGNNLYQNKKNAEASLIYAQAIGIIEQLQLKEKPGEEEWVTLADMKIPFLLNYSQCQLLLGNYYEVIEQCSHVLNHQPDNVKALFRRGKAHLNAWNPKEAKSDFEKAAVIDPSLSKAVQQQLNQLEEMIKEKNKSDKAWLSQAFGKTTSS